MKILGTRKILRTAKHFSLAVITVLASIPSIAFAEAKPVESKRDALRRASHLTGFHYDQANKSAIENNVQIISLQDSTTPFLGTYAKGRRVWRVDLSDARMVVDFDSPLDWARDADIIAYVDSATGHLLKIVCDLAPLDSLLDLEISASEAEAQLRQVKEEYVGFPTDSATVSFATASLSGPRNPGSAKQVVGQYVLLDFNGLSIYPAWVITMRGIPRVQLGGPGDWVPIYALNRIRMVVPGIKGKTIFTSLTPGVQLKPEDRARLFPKQDTTKD